MKRLVPLLLLMLAANAGAYTSEYIETLTIPACNGDASVQIIDSVADWDEINNPTKTTFCVVPGDYTAAGTISLTVSGTSGVRRYITLHDGDPREFDDLSVNPANVDVAGRAIIHGLKFLNVDYWVVNRITQSGSDVNGTEVYGDYNIFNNLLLEQAPRWQIVMYSGSDYNTLQYSVCRDQVDFADTMCAGVTDNMGDYPANEVHNYENKFLSNEVYNYTDGIQLVHSPNPAPTQDFSGTIIDNNDIYITDVRYVDDDGNPDPGGEYACAENGIDIKVGGTGPLLAERVTVSNNRIRGYRWANCPGMSDAGYGIVTPTTSLGQYIQMLGNILWDNSVGLINGSGPDLYGLVVSDNIISDSKPPSGYAASGIHTGAASPADGVMEISNNAITGHPVWTVVQANKEYTCNFVRDSEYAAQRLLGDGSSNMYFTVSYALNQIGTGDATDEVGAVAQANFQDACFAIKHITDPQQICLPEVIPSATTPTAAGCVMTVPLLETPQIMLAGPAVASDVTGTSFTSTIPTDTNTGTWYIAVRSTPWRTQSAGYTYWEEQEDTAIITAAQSGVDGITYANTGTVSSFVLSDSVTGLSAITTYYVGWVQSP